jgi:YggT family protein
MKQARVIAKCDRPGAISASSCAAGLVRLGLALAPIGGNARSMSIILEPLLTVVYFALDLYWYVVLATVIFSWLIAFGVINTYNHAVRTIGDVLSRLTEPALRPIRRWIPDFGAVDLSPVALWLILLFLKMVVERLILAVRVL